MFWCETAGNKREFNLRICESIVDTHVIVSIYKTGFFLNLIRLKKIFMVYQVFVYVFLVPKDISSAFPFILKVINVFVFVISNLFIICKQPSVLDAREFNSLMIGYLFILIGL